MDTVKAQQLIVCTKARRGKGDNKLSPIRVLTEVFDLDGNLVAENDPHSFSIETLVDFIKHRFSGDGQKQVLEWAFEYFMEEQ